MNKLISIFATLCLLAATQLSAIAQQKPTVQHTWRLVSGWLDQEELHFERIASPETFHNWAQTFTFGEDKQITYKLTIPPGRGMCANGLLYIESGSFKISKRNKRMRLKLEGGHMMLNRFTFEVKYKVLELTEELLILRKKKTRKAEISSFYESMEVS